MSKYHIHEECETRYVFSGRKGICIKDRQIIMEKGGLLFINSNVIHQTVSVSDEPNETIIIRFRPHLLKWQWITPDINYDLLFGKEYLYIEPGAMDQQFIQEIMKTLITAYDRKMNGVFNLKMMEFIVYLVVKSKVAGSSINAKQSNVKKGHFEKITSYMATRQYDVTLDELSDTFFMSRYYICHLFKDISGMTVNEYIHSFRIRKAQELLVNSEDSIASIADKCGYDTLAAFSRMFKLHTGLSPSGYRKKYVSVKN